METQEFKKIFWTEASKWGLILGLTMVFIRVAQGIADSQLAAMLLMIAQIVAIFAVNMAVGRKMAALKSGEGYTFGNALSQILAVMLFTGLIVGHGEVAISRLTPGYFDAMFDSFEQFRGVFGNERIDMLNDNKSELIGVMRNPLYIIISKTMDMLLLGGVIGLFCAVLLRSEPKMHGGDENGE